VLGDRTAGFAYSRIDNPTVAAFADGVAALEGAAAPEDVAGQAFCSGMAAITTVFMTFLRSGSHVVAPAPVFSGTQSLLTKVLSRFGVTTGFVDYSDLRQVHLATPGVRGASRCANPSNTLQSAQSCKRKGEGHVRRSGRPVEGDLGSLSRRRST
jgi:cystathionine beta-lyase/cystathionine gamma-synthase